MITKQGSLSSQAVKRQRGGELIQKGYDNEEIAYIVGVTPTSVPNWRNKLKEHSDDLSCLDRKEGSGGQSLLTDKQKRQLKKMILKGARAHGYPTERWTSKIVAHLIKRKFGITMAPRTVRDLLPTLGLSPQMPVVKSHKYSDKAVLDWAARTWKRLKKKRRDSVSL